MLEEKIDNNAKARGATFNSGLPDINNRKYDKPLPILLSSRVRLNDEQRGILKDAWNKYRYSQQPQQAAATPGSTVTTQTAYAERGLPGLSALVVTDLIATRESIALTTVLNISAALGVEVITKKQMQEAFDGYWSFITTEAKKLYGN